MLAGLRVSRRCGAYVLYIRERDGLSAFAVQVRCVDVFEAVDEAVAFEERDADVFTEARVQLERLRFRYSAGVAPWKARLICRFSTSAEPVRLTFNTTRPSSKNCRPEPGVPLPLSQPAILSSGIVLSWEPA